MAEAPERFCIYTGKAIPADAVFCACCGRRQPLAPTKERAAVERIRRGVKSLSGDAKWVLAIGALLTGSPGLVIELLEIKPILGIAGNIAATAPVAFAMAGTLAVVIAAILFRQQEISDPYVIYGASFAVGLVWLISLDLATLTGGMPDPVAALVVSIDPTSPTELMDFYVTLPFRLIPIYFEFYCWTRFIMGSLGGLFLTAAIASRFGVFQRIRRGFSPE